jgi:hypothetical protein
MTLPLKMKMQKDKQQKIIFENDTGNVISCFCFDFVNSAFYDCIFGAVYFLTKC